MIFGVTTFSENSFSSLPPNIYINISGQQLTTTLGNIVIDANGNITIQTGPEIALDVYLGNVTVGVASFLNITGEQINISQGEEVIDASATTGTLIGEEITPSVNTITVGEGGNAVITGQELNTNTGNISFTGNGTVTATGIQINVNASTLKFWDPITGNVTETWSNIH